MLISSIIITFLLTFAILVFLLKTNLKNMVLDTPNQRSLHHEVVPRSGGVAIMAGVLLTWAFYEQTWFWSILVLILVVISLLDDIKGLSIKWRFLIQMIVSALFIYYGLSALAWWLSVLIVFGIVWMVNLYNFMDGSDGLAGGMAVIGFSTYALAAYMADDHQIVLMSASLASAALAFLIFNFHPAKIFMGDGGSIPLGFLAASIGVYGCQHDLWAIWFPVLVFSPFIIDATVTLLKRGYFREKVWQAHRSHYYQRLVQMGYGHTKTALYEYSLMISVALSALVLNRSGLMQVAIGLFIWIVIYAILLFLIDQRWKQFQHMTAVIR